MGSFGYDIINVGMGPTIDLGQEFELDPTLWVTLLFDHQVEILGQLVTEFTLPWDLLPSIKFLFDNTWSRPPSSWTRTCSIRRCSTLISISYRSVADHQKFPLLDVDGKLGIKYTNKAVDLFTAAHSKL